MASKRRGQRDKRLTSYMLNPTEASLPRSPLVSFFRHAYLVVTQLQLPQPVEPAERSRECASLQNHDPPKLLNRSKLVSGMHMTVLNCGTT